MAKMKSYRALEAGYLSSTGQYVTAGEIFQFDGEPGNWMESLDADEAAKLKAIEIAGDPTKDADPSLETLSVAQLQTLAADRKIPFQGLDKKDLVAALQAERGTTA